MRTIKHLRHFRKKAGLTQEELAEKIGIHPNSVARYERGELTPSLKMVCAITQALGVSESELLNGPQSKEITIRVRLGKVREGKEDMEINMKDNNFDLTLDKDGAVGITGGAKFESLEQLQEKIKEMGDLLIDAYKFQVAHGRV